MGRSASWEASRPASPRDGTTEGGVVRRIRCVGAVVTDRQGRLLLIQRANAPGRGQWSLPGGRVEPGETDEAALVREMAEETGLEIVVGPLLGRVERPAGDDAVYDIADHLAHVVSGVPLAGDDASDLGWFDDLRPLAAVGRLTDGLLGVLAEWGVAAAHPDAAHPTRPDASADPGAGLVDLQDSTGTGRPGCSPPFASP
ncbi:MAG: NUDIX hydrolase [Frankia sp.]